MEMNEINRYEDLIYKMIKCFKKWGLWQESAAFYYNGNKYAACDKDECINGFRDLTCVNISEYEEDSAGNFFVANFYDRNREQDDLVPYEIRLQYNSEMVDLYDWGFYSVEVKELAFDKQLEVVARHPEFMDSFEDDPDYMATHPDEYPDFPKSWEFDSADKFIEYRDNYIDELRLKYIKELDKRVTMDNDAEAEICEIIIDAGLQYFEEDGMEMFIGKDIPV